MGIQHLGPLTARLRRVWPTWAVLLVAVAAWVVAALLTLHWGGSSNFDLRIYRDAERTLSGNHTYSIHFSRAHLRFTYPPFALLLLSPLASVPVVALEVAWWLLSSAALVTLSYLDTHWGHATSWPTRRSPWPRCSPG